MNADAVLRALAEPQRRRILTLVGSGELPAGAIADHFDITPQAVSQHLRVLKDAGLLQERRDGTRRLYALRPEALDSVRSFLRRAVARLPRPAEGHRRKRRPTASAPAVNDDAYTTSVRIDARPADVFPYFTDPELMLRWMGDWAELQARPGGRLAIDVNGIPIRGEYLVVEPPERVVFSWGAAGNDSLPPGSTTVEIVLRADGDGTLVELAHRDLPPEERPAHGIGWGHFLDRLVVAAAGGDPGPDPWASR